MPAKKKQNKAVNYEFNIVDTYDAGLVLTGAEVKSAKKGQVDLRGAFIHIDKTDEAWIKGMKISKYSKASHSQKDYKPDRARKLLLTHKEIMQIKGKTSASGLTIVPLSVYTTPSLVKVKIAVVKGKKQWDKRQTIKEREFKRKLDARFKHS